MGKHKVVFDFPYYGPGLAKGGTGVLKVDGNEVDKRYVEHTVPFTFQWDETFDVGMNTGTPVSLLEYTCETPFRSTVKLKNLTFDLQPQQLIAQEQRTMQLMGQRNNRAGEYRHDDVRPVSR